MNNPAGGELFDELSHPGHHTITTALLGAGVTGEG